MLNEIERFQPYKRPHHILPPLLLLLRKLDDIDKHRFLNVAIANLGGIGPFEVLDSNGVVPLLESYQIVLYTGEVKDGTEIARVVFGRPRPSANAKFEAHLVMSITNPLEIGNKWLELAYMLPRNGARGSHGDRVRFQQCVRPWLPILLEMMYDAP